jgi:hypothetical protein
MLARLRTHLPAWRRALRRRRRTLAVLVVLAAVAALLPSLLPPSLRGADVVVLRSDLPAGTVLRPEHLGTLRIAEELIPPRAARSVHDLTGRTTAFPLADGTPVLPGMLEGEGAAAIPPGSVVMAVPVPSVLVPHLGPGARIELLSADPVTGTSLRVAATVVELSSPPGGGTGAPGAGPEPPAAIIALDRTRSGEVAQALGAGALTVSIIG